MVEITRIEISSTINLATRQITLVITLASTKSLILKFR